MPKIDIRDIEAAQEAIARGKRLKLLRQIAGLTRDQLAEAAEISNTTISYWENATYSGITQKGAEKVIKAISEIGIDCSVVWLMHGVGSGPNIPAGTVVAPPPYDVSTLGTFISGSIIGSSLQKEIDVFVSTNRKAVITSIENTYMAPFLRKGDVVGGLWTPSEKLASQEFCIVKIENNLEVRNVQPLAKKGIFDLSYMTYAEDMTRAYQLKNIKLSELAPIIRIWRKFE